MIRPTRVSAILAVLIFSLTGCDNPFGPKSDLESARDRWESRGPASYSYTVSRGCFCPMEAIGPVTVVVKNGVVESRRYTETGVAVPDNYTAIFPNVEGLFAQIDNARKNKVDGLDTAFDNQYGFPTRINVDVKTEWADDEYAYTVKNFVAR